MQTNRPAVRCRQVWQVSMHRGVCIVTTLTCLAGCFAPRLLPSQRRPITCLDQIPVQYESGTFHATFAVSEEQWAKVRNYFDPPTTSPHNERCAIRRAVAIMEQIAATQTPTRLDRAGNQRDPSGAGAMDCLDESTNTRTYLLLFDQHGLLRWHDILGTAHRGPLQFDIHNSAAIRDRTTQRIYVVDSWHLDNGQPPYVQAFEDWMRKRPFPNNTP